MISMRNLEYQTVPFLIGEADDRLTVVFSAGRRLAESVDPERREAVYETVHKILTRVCEGELNEQSAKLEKLLYGRRAA